MRRKVLTVCILLAICLSVGAYALESFWDGDTAVACEYRHLKQEFLDWKQTLGDDLLARAAHEVNGRNIRFITKLSNNDVRLINKALQMYEVMKNEIYMVSLVSTTGVGKAFYVLINGKGQWDFVGIEYRIVT